MRTPCLALCIDDLCHGNPEDTLCGGCYCAQCRRQTFEPGVCDDCSEDGEFEEADAADKEGAI